MEGEKAKRAESKLKSAEVGEPMTIRLPPELARALRMHCASERRSVTNAVTEAVRALLAGDKPS